MPPRRNRLPFPASSDSPVRRTRRTLIRLLPLTILLGGGLVIWIGLDAGAYLSFEALREHHRLLSAEVARLGPLAVVMFVAVYALVVALSLPIGSLLTVAAGFLFGTWLATLSVVIGATLGAVVVFLAARTALAAVFRPRAADAIQRMKAGFRENALSYMLVLRLIPLFPFWLVNLVPALLGVPLRIYFIGTLLGIVPGTFVYASIGNGLEVILAAGGTPDLGIIFSPEILVPILGMAVLALLPVLYKHWRKRRGR